MIRKKNYVKRRKTVGNRVTEKKNGRHVVGRDLPEFIDAAVIDSPLSSSSKWRHKTIKTFYKFFFFFFTKSVCERGGTAPLLLTRRCRCDWLVR